MNGYPMKHIFKSYITLLLTTLAAQYACMAQKPVMKWDFETIKNRSSIEESTSIADTIEGNFEWVQGVTGKGLHLDGFTTRVISKGKVIRNPGTAFTIEEWASLGELVSTMAIKGSLTYPLKTSCILGMVTVPGRPGNTIRTWTS